MKVRCWKCKGKGYIKPLDSLDVFFSVITFGIMYPFIRAIATEDRCPVCRGDCYLENNAR